MTSSLSRRLNEARRRGLVGRVNEQALFRSALAAPELPFHLLHVFGPGGVGKTTLLRAFAAACEMTGTPVIVLDGRHCEPSPDAFLEALRLALGLEPGVSPLAALAERDRRSVLLIDTYELLAPLENWLREVLLPQLPDHMLIVTAGRHAPTPAWRTDPGWQHLLRTLPLRNLSPTESRTYLSQRNVPAAQHQAVLDFTHGHALALSLVADMFDQRGDFRFQPEAAPDVVKVLLELLVQEAPSPQHRAALESCALVRLMTESLLSEMLDEADAHPLFEWLRGLSFIESGPAGLVPHDLVREALIVDLRWRNPDRYAELHRRARAYYNRRLDHTSVQEQQRVLLDYIFLHRDNPVVRPFFEWQEDGGVWADVYQEADRPALLAMVAQHEGAASAELADRWLAIQPHNVLVFRDGQRQPTGFLLTLALHQTAAADRNADPATRAAWDYLQTRTSLRTGEGASHFRFWMARDTYQAVSPTQSLIFVNMVRHYRVTPGLAFTFIPCADPAFWAPIFGYADLQRLPEADFEVDGRPYGVYGHDWRIVPPLAWLEMLAERETAAMPHTPSHPPPAFDPVLVLSRPDFAAAVRSALRDLTRPEAQRANPLLRSRVVIDRAGPTTGRTDRAAALQALLHEAATSLKSSPRRAKAYHALAATYLSPAPSQEQAAEALDLPFSTFRRYLKNGIEGVVEVLWQREIGGYGG